MPSPIGSAFADYQMRRAVAAMRAGVPVRSAVLNAPSPSTAPTYAGQLAEKDAQVRDLLLGYGANLTTVDLAAAADAQVLIEAWKENHASVWSQIRDRILPTDGTVTESDALALPAPLLCAYVEAMYRDAHDSLSMYTSGAWADLVEAGSFQMAFVRDDATARLDIYDSILSLEESGALAAAYGVTSSRGLKGLGTPIAIGEGLLIILGVVVAIFALGSVVTSVMTTRMNNQIAKARCDKYLETRDPAFAKGCEPVETDNVKIATYAIGVAGLVAFGYLLLTQIPSLKKGLST